MILRSVVSRHLNLAPIRHHGGEHRVDAGKGLPELARGDIQQFVGQHYQPQNAVVSVAGKVVWEEVKSAVENCFGDWQGQAEEKLQLQEPPGGYHHIPHDSSQMQIAVAYSSVPYNHADYFRARGAVGVLSDGMSSRLFTEMRENRGLCYTVYAAYHSLRDEGRVMAYARDQYRKGTGITECDAFRNHGDWQMASIKTSCSD